jgi:hypothetical protein
MGYKAALEMLANWDQEHKLPSLSSLDGGRGLGLPGHSGQSGAATIETGRKSLGRRGRGLRRNSI